MRSMKLFAAAALVAALIAGPAMAQEAVDAVAPAAADAVAPATAVTAPAAASEATAPVRARHEKAVKKHVRKHKKAANGMTSK